MLDSFNDGHLGFNDLKDSSKDSFNTGLIKLINDRNVIFKHLNLNFGFAEVFHDHSFNVCKHEAHSFVSHFFEVKGKKLLKDKSLGIFKLKLKPSPENRLLVFVLKVKLLSLLTQVGVAVKQ